MKEVEYNMTSIKCNRGPKGRMGRQQWEESRRKKNH